MREMQHQNGICGCLIHSVVLNSQAHKFKRVKAGQLIIIESFNTLCSPYSHMVRGGWWWSSPRQEDQIERILLVDIWAETVIQNKLYKEF